MKLVNIIICFFWTLSLSCRSVNNSDIYRYKRKFERHKKDFENLVRLLKTQNIKVGYPINENVLPESIQTILINLDISDVNLNLTQCDNIADYQFTSSWSSKATLYFSKDTCNKRQTEKGFHDKTSKMIEVWGLGDDWIMWIDHDFI